MKPQFWGRKPPIQIGAIIASGSPGGTVGHVDSVNNAGQFLDGVLSNSATVPVALGLATIVGLIFWLVGKRFAKPGAALSGAILGAAVGLVLAGSLGGPSGASPGPAGTLVAEQLGTTSSSLALNAKVAVPLGLLIGAVAGLLLNRAASVSAMAIVGGAALTLSAAGVLAVRPLNHTEQTTAIDRNAAWRTELTSLVGHARDGLNSAQSADSTWRTDALEEAEHLARAAEAVGIRWSGGAGRANPSDNETTKHHRSGLADRASAAIHTHVSGLAHSFSDVLSVQPGGHRAVMVMAAILGIAGGVVLGLAKPGMACAAATAMLGSALWLFGIAALSAWLNAPWSAWLDRPASQWVCAWGVVAALGMCVQWSGLLSRRRPHPTAGPSRA